MRIMDFVRQELIVSDLKGREKVPILTELAVHLASHVRGIACDELVHILLEREQLASTAIGEGIAIPHGRCDAVDRLVACVGRAPAGVSFNSVDGNPTHVFFVLLAPQGLAGIHLKALARISRLFKDPGFRTRLMEARDAAEMYRTIANEDAKF